MTQAQTRLARAIDRLTRVGPAATVAWAVLATTGVGVIDVWTGTDVRLLSLYLLPVAWCSWRLGHRGTVFAAGLALSTWGSAQYLSGVDNWTPAIWSFNLVSQGLALLTIGWLMAELSRRLEIEKAVSRTDPLTGLRNRRGLTQDGALALAMCQRHARPVALAYIDLDNFKQVNDRFGHARGDAVIQACAQALGNGCRVTDLPARLGGDEFVVLLPEATAQQAHALMQRVRQAFASAAACRHTGVDMTVGVLADVPATQTLDQLLVQADTLMYGAKREGKGRIVVHKPDPIIDAVPPEPT